VYDRRKMSRSCLFTDGIWNIFLKSVFDPKFRSQSYDFGFYSYASVVVGYRVFEIEKTNFYHSTSERSEWNGRKFTQKKILARPHRGRGMSSVCLSVRLSVCPSTLLC
jgi:hypothetical protein